MTDRIDWARIAREYQRHIAHLTHDETGQWCGGEFYAEALRRTFGYSPNDGSDGRRELPYDTVAGRTGLVTATNADHIREAHSVIDRLNREAAEKKAAEAREEARTILQDAAQRCADHIRGRCNDRTVPSRYRRDGALLAADWIDPRVPKDRFGNIVRPTEGDAA